MTNTLEQYVIGYIETKRSMETMAKKTESKEPGTALAIRTEMGLGRVENPEQALVVGPGAPKTLPKLVQLKEPGDYIDGMLVSEGSSVEVKRRTPEGDEISVEVKTWVFEIKPDVLVKLMSNYQLTDELPSNIGKRVRVILNGTFDTRSGNRVKDFFIQVWDQEAELVEQPA